MTLVDQTERDLIEQALERSLFVEAGAGTGKTTALVKRIVWLVAKGHLPEGIRGVAAITFTENAAAELRNRIRTALGEATTALTGDEQLRCKQALEDLEDAALSTLHGFAARLLSDYPMEAGLPVGFGVQDEIRAGLERDRWWDRVVDEALDDPELKPVWQTALALGLTPKSLRKIVDTLHQGWDLLEHPIPSPDPAQPWDLMKVLDPLREAAQYGPRGPAGDGLTDYLLLELPALMADLEAEVDDLGRAAVLLTSKIPGVRKGQAPAWKAAGISKATVTDLLVEAGTAWEQQLAEARSASLVRLVVWLRDVVLEDAARRRHEGALYFHDLLVLSRDLLSARPDVRLDLRERWPAILVDEFQDTDPLQVELVHYLASTHHPSNWEDARVEPGRLFFVGDPKQSIYRFRRADVGLYTQVQEKALKQDRISITQNFRSRPGVLTAVNTGVSTLMHNQLNQVPYTPLAPARPEPADEPGPTVLLLGGAHDESMDGVRDHEAEHVAATCRRVVKEQWQVREHDKTEEPRNADFSDIAILVPTRTSLSRLEKQLQKQDVPYRIESRSLVWETDIVRELLTVLEAIADPSDAVAVVTALRSAGFGCTDPDLLAWKQAGGRWDYRLDPPEGADALQVAKAMAELQRYHQLRWWTPINQLIDLVIRERRLVELTTGLRRPRDHWRRLRFVTDQARAFLDAGGSQLIDFVRWAREQAERGADSVETVVNEPDDNAVRILTIHSAKGLEFPVTMITGINVDDRLDVQTLFYEGSIEVRTKGFETPGWKDAHTAERSLQEAEGIRLLYVALTRAADHLVVSLHHKVSGPVKNHAKRLFVQLDELVAQGAVYEPSLGVMAESLAPEKPQATVDLDARTRFVQEREDLLKRVRTSLPVTASSLSGEDDGPVDELTQLAEDAELADEPVTWRAPVTGGATLGSAVHKTLELIDFGPPDEQRVRTVAEAVTAELEAPHLAAETTRRALVALHSDLLLQAGTAVWKEVPVSAPVDGRRVEGYIDLVIKHPDGLVVIDYKTDAAATAEAVAEKVQHYTPQLRAYARALSSATGLRVVRAALLFIGPAEAVEADVPL